MRKLLYKKSILFITFIILLFSIFCAQAMRTIQKKEDIKKLFPQDPKQIRYLTDRFIGEAQEQINKIISIKKEARTFISTPLALDRLSCFSNLALFLNSLDSLKELSPKKGVREAAREQVLKMKNFRVEQIENSRQVYQALKEYEQVSYEDYLSEEEEYYLEKIIEDFKREGLGLSSKKLERVKKLKMEINELEQQFSANILKDNTTISVAPEDLAGLDEEFIDGLGVDEQGDCVLGTDYPTAFTVLSCCKIEETRKKMHIAFNNVAYPKNKIVLQKLIEKRDEFAQLLGFESYADFDLDDQMAKTPKIVHDFLTSLFKGAENKARQEFELLCKNLPKGVVLSKNGKIKPWDVKYINSHYEKKNFKIDIEKITKYFPEDYVLKETLKIYEEFFGIRFKILQADNLWHKDVKIVEVYSHEEALIGYILLDLYSRKDKSSQAYSSEIVPPIQRGGPAINLVVTNFSKIRGNIPVLLTLDEIGTLWHEFGHALHYILGRTELATFAGFNVKEDFGEMPSQMLDQWPYEKEILKRISCHYKTKKPLSSKMIDKIIESERFYIGHSLLTQCFYSFLSLQCFGKNKDKNPKKIYDRLKNGMSKYIEPFDEDNMYASFGHLVLYDMHAKYYGYLWSNVSATDIFYTIKRQGLLNAEVGKKYVRKVLSKGGSQEPGILLENFLGRESNQDAFIERLGLSQEIVNSNFQDDLGVTFDNAVGGRKRGRKPGAKDRDPKRRRIVL